jgi:hypothetical protein
MNRRALHQLLLIFAAAVASRLALAADSTVVTVYKSPACGCCSQWVEHLRDSGFEVKTVDTNDLGNIKSAAGVTPALASCHTAWVDGYLIEGHVPPEDIRRLLKEHPAVKGLTVPGMPSGAPGMEAPNPEHHKVLAIDADGKTTVFAEH